MQGKLAKVIAGLSSVCLLALGTVPGARADETQIKGMIISRTGERLIVNGSGGKITVVLTEQTRTKDDTGLFGLGTEEMGATVLIPGLKVSVEGTSDGQDKIIAKTITVDGDDLETAEMIQSGLHPTAEQVAANIQTLAVHEKGIAVNQQNISANQQDIAVNQKNIATHKEKIEQNMKDIQENTDRFSQLAEYEVKAETTVKFNVGSPKISAADLEQLKQLAQTAIGQTGYIVEVKGFADSRGSAIMNEKLSENRAKAVVSFLIQQCNVPVRHIVAPGAMGEYQPASSNETKEGRAENRRVEVKVLVNKGIQGS
jgi:outer membrane protein OmpA-like peptidoglycan-associated protein